MALYREDIISIELESGTIHRSYMNHSIGLGDNLANRFGVRLFRNGEEVSTNGASCQGIFVPPAGNPILISGNTYTGTSENVAWVQLPQACYAEEGNFSLAIKVIGGGVTGTMRIVDGMVDNTGSGTPVAPTETVPTYQEIIALYDEMVTATEEAEGITSALHPRNVMLPDEEISTTAPQDFYKFEGEDWEQGSWSSSGDEESSTWIRTGMIDGGFIIHNKRPEYGYVVGKFTTAGAFAGYPWMSELVNDEFYYIPDVGSDYKVRMRQRHMTDATQTLTPDGETVEVFRFSGIMANSLRYVENGIVESYGTSLASVAGHGNIIFTIRASYWTDEPFNGLCINMQYATNYDVQIALPLESNDMAFRIVNRNTKEVYLDWQTLTGKLEKYAHYVLPDAAAFSNIFANVAGSGQRYGNLAKSKWTDIPFGGCAMNLQYTATYDIQIIYSLYDTRIAYRHVNRTNQTPYDDWHIIGGNLYGKKVSIIGDSRSSYSGTVPEGNAVYYPKSSGAVLTSLSQMWWKRVLDYFGMTLVVNDSYSGGYVSYKSGEPDAKILSSDAAVANLGNTAPDIIMIYAGVNDWNGNAIPIGTYDGTQTFPSTNTNFRDALALMISKVQNKFPAADIWLCTNPYCCPAGTGSTASYMPVPKAGSGGTSLDAFNKAIKDIAAMFGCHVIDFALCGVNYKNIVTYSGDYSTDNGLHYNASGHEKLAKVAISALAEYYK